MKLLALLQITESLLFLRWAIAVFEHLPPSIGSIFIRMCAAAQLTKYRKRRDLTLSAFALPFQKISRPYKGSQNIVVNRNRSKIWKLLYFAFTELSTSDLLLTRRKCGVDIVQIKANTKILFPAAALEVRQRSWFVWTVLAFLIHTLPPVHKNVLSASHQ